MGALPLAEASAGGYLTFMIKSLLSSLFDPHPPRLPEPDARLALAALLVRLARSDGDYAQSEMDRIDRVLAAYHHLSPFEAVKLRGEAEEIEAAAPDTVRFTRALKSATAHEDRAGLMQALWSVALADGGRDAQEDSFLRMVANLLGLNDVESAHARQKAAKE